MTGEEAKKLSAQGSWEEGIFAKVKEAARAGLYRFELTDEMDMLVRVHFEELRNLGFYRIERIIKDYEEPFARGFVKYHYRKHVFLTWDEDEVGV